MRRVVLTIFIESHGFSFNLSPMKPILLYLPLAFGMIGCVTTQTANKESETKPEPVKFVVSFPETVRSEPVTGRVLLFFSQDEKKEPREDMSWFDPSPVYAVDVENLQPGEEVIFTPDELGDPDDLAFPGPMAGLRGNYRAQALIDFDQTRRNFNTGPGNLYTQVIDVEMQGRMGETYALLADQVIKTEEKEDTEWVKLVKVKSQLLSDFHGRDIYMRAGVLLPRGYTEEPNREYPVYYSIPGFGGRHDFLWNFSDPKNKRHQENWEAWSSGENPFRGFYVVLDPDVPLGHSVFANSANNGPVGDALIKELIPAIEERFRAIAKPAARFVGGHSSGGWSSLWLQVTYPDFFGGCWSTAPDPVDFRSFQTMNLYEDRNGHWTPTGQPRPVGRSRYEPTLYYTKFNHMEYVLGYGGQLDSFDAVFSPRGEDGNPLQVMDKLTGDINPEVAEYWKRYDIRLIVENNWYALGPRLQGKIRVIGGGWDTFYLNPSLQLLKDFLDTKDHGGYIEILPGNHGSFRTKEFNQRIWQEIADQFASTGL